MNGQNSYIIYHMNEYNYILELLETEDKHNPLTANQIYKRIRSKFCYTNVSNLNKVRLIFHAGDIAGRDTRAWCYRHNINPNVATSARKDPTKIYCNIEEA